MNRWPQFRDVGLFIFGVAGVVHETIFSHGERPTLLILFAAMMGLPAFLRPQDWNSGGRQLPPPPPLDPVQEALSVEQSTDIRLHEIEDQESKKATPPPEKP